MPALNKREVRAHRSIERRALTDMEKEGGFIGAFTSIIPYNSDSGVISERGKRFIEQIAPSAFARSIKDATDILAFVGHTDDPLSAFARSGVNMTLTDTPNGLRWEALAPDTAACRDLAKLIDSGVIRGASFEFSVNGASGETWQKRGDTELRTITDATLYAVNPVAWPAYADSALTVGMRSRQSSYEVPSEEPPPAPVTPVVPEVILQQFPITGAQAARLGLTC